MKYRIREWNDMVNEHVLASGSIMSRDEGIRFEPFMKHLCGMELETNKLQSIKGYSIDSWMIEPISDEETIIHKPCDKPIEDCTCDDAEVKIIDKPKDIDIYCNKGPDHNCPLKVHGGHCNAIKCPHQVQARA